MPPFTQGNPTTWLYRVESQFRIADLTDEVLQADTVLNALLEEIYRKLIQRVSATHPLTYHLLKKALLETCSLPITERAAHAINLAVNPQQDLSAMESWGMIENLLSLPDFDGSRKQQEVSLSREIFLRQLLPEVRTQIPQPYTMPLDVLIQTAQHLTDCVKATKWLTGPTLPVNSIQQEEGAEQEVNVVTRRHPPPHNKWSSPGMCHYHKRLDKDALICLPPCSFARSKNRGGGGQQDRQPWQPKNPGSQNH